MLRYWPRLAITLVACLPLACAADALRSESSTSEPAPGVGSGTATCSGAPIPDRDSDGFSDSVENAMGTSPDDAKDNPTAKGMNVVLVPWSGEPTPKAISLSAETRLAKADVVILLDTTGSMAGTIVRLQSYVGGFMGSLVGTVDDVAVGLAGYGDFPINDNQNSNYDVPFYLVHRVMTAHTSGGLDSLVAASGNRNIITSGLGPWFAQMRGGDKAEQGWEALRQVATGIGISYPGGSVPAFSPSAAYPVTPPASEEVGTIGGLGFRSGALPIVIMITDTNNHDDSFPGTSPSSSSRAEAVAALASIHARVIGLMAWQTDGRDDLTFLANTTGARVPPEAWGTGSSRPANCPVGKCCVVGADSSAPGTDVQPDPVSGMCTLVFQSDRYEESLSALMTQAVTGLARGAKISVSALVEDDAADSVDVTKAFVDGLTPNAGGDCSDPASVTYGGKACFTLTTRTNTTVPATQAAQRFDAKIDLAGEGLAKNQTIPVSFVVPPSGECGGSTVTPVR